MVRKTPDAPFEKMTLLRRAARRHRTRACCSTSPARWTISSRRRACARPLHLKVVDLPYVQKLELEYRFPAYTGLEPRKVEDGGDIAVLKGTEVRVHVVPTMSGAGRTDPARTTRSEGGADRRCRRPLARKFVADKDGFYRVELDAPTGEHVTASPQYTIDVLDDNAPTVSISKPGRDTRASPIEEVFVEAKAEDDYGVARPRSRVLRERRGGEDDAAVRRQEPADGSDGGPHLLSRGARRAARRLRLLLRARGRQRRRRRREADDERPVLPADPAAAQGVQTGRIGRRRRRGVAAAGSSRWVRCPSNSGRSSRRRST